jgi:hypothetical protein
MPRGHGRERRLARAAARRAGLLRGMDRSACQRVSVSACQRVSVEAQLVTSGALPLRPGGGVAPCTPSGALPPAPPAGLRPCTPVGALPPTPPAGRCPCTPAKRKGAGRPFSLGNLSSGLCVLHETCMSGHTLHGGPSFTRVSNCVRALRCTNVHPRRRTERTRQRRVPALHTCAPMTIKRTPWQRRVPRALVHRGRPRGWAHVTCAGERKRSSVVPCSHPLAPPGTTTAREWAAPAAS